MKCPFSGDSKSNFESSPLTLNILKVHPTQGIDLEKANKKLNSKNGSDESIWDEGAYKFCGPFTSANSMGWWVFPAIDLDVTYLGDGKWDYTFIDKYTDGDLEIYKQIYKDKTPEYPYQTAQSKVSFSAASKNMIQIWTGRTFRTPKNWGLFVTNPINFHEHHSRPWYIQSGYLETDWLPADIWTNIIFTCENVKFEFRKNMWPPLAQIIPIHIESVHGDWKIQESLPSETNPLYLERNKYWHKKWIEKHEKEPRTFYKERAEHRSDKDYNIGT